MNSFNTLRVAKANFVPTATGTYTSNTFLPEGAILKSVTSVENTALATSDVGTVTFKVGSQSITGALGVAAFTGVDAHALTNADGLATTVGGALSATIANNFTAGDIDVYVEYYYAG